MLKPDKLYNSVKTSGHKKKKKKSGWVLKLIGVFSFFVLLAMLLAYSAYFINPQTIWFPAFFGLAFQFIFLLNLFFLFYWLMKGRKMFWLTFALLLPSLLSVQKLYPIHFYSAVPPTNSFKVMSYNVRLFDLYNWTKNKETRNNIFSFLKSEANDILCLQEVFVDDTKEFETIDTLVKLQHAKNKHVEYTTTLRGKHHWGIATLTSFPIVGKGKIDFEGTANNLCIFTDVLINADTVRIYNVHLQSVLFSKQDYKFIEELEQNKIEDFDASKSIFRRLRNAFLKRAVQVDTISKHMTLCKYPVILAGDFNDTPFSYTYNKMGNGLYDAFSQSGNGLGRTYTGTFPYFRIDYILYSNHFSSYIFETHNKFFSDHKPISCFFSKN